jgi:asparagine N-glycosylation enzyme membrane subunit Stt3
MEHGARGMAYGETRPTLYSLRPTKHMDHYPNFTHQITFSTTLMIFIPFLPLFTHYYTIFFSYCQVKNAFIKKFFCKGAVFRVIYLRKA